MPVPVMDVREVRMAVRQRGVPVRVRVGFCRVKAEIVGVPMVLIVRVLVGMLQKFVHVGMLVPLAHMQPNAPTHQGRGDPECRSRRLAKRADGKRHTDERGG